MAWKIERNSCGEATLSNGSGATIDLSSAWGSGGEMGAEEFTVFLTSLETYLDTGIDTSLKNQEELDNQVAGAIERQIRKGCLIIDNGFVQFNKASNDPLRKARFDIE